MYATFHLFHVAHILNKIVPEAYICRCRRKGWVDGNINIGSSTDLGMGSAKAKRGIANNRESNLSADAASLAMMDLSGCRLLHY